MIQRERRWQKGAKQNYKDGCEMSDGCVVAGLDVRIIEEALLEMKMTTIPREDRDECFFVEGARYSTVS